MIINFKFKYLIVILCLINNSGCEDSSSKVERYLKSAADYFEKENYEFARLEYKNALQINNKLVDAYTHLALIDKKEKNWSGMFANLSKVAELEPLNIEVRLKLVKLLILQRQFHVATIQIDEVLSLSKDNPKALALKGALLLKKKDFNSAMKMANKALAFEPDFVDAISLKALVFQSKNDFESALTIINQALSADPNELALHLLKLQLDIKQKDNSAIKTDYLGLIQRFPKKIEFKLALSKYYLDMGEQDKFLQLIQQLIKNNPKNLQPKVLLSKFLIETNEVKAEETIKSIILENRDATEFYFLLANLYIQQEKLAEAKKSLNQVIAIRSDNKTRISAKVLLAKLAKLAKLALQSDDKATASILVEEVLALDAKNITAILLKARITIANGLYDRAISNLHTIIRDFPASDEAIVLLAQTYLKKNVPELANKNFQKALLLNPGNFTAIMPVVSELINKKDIIHAEYILQKALEVKPNHAGILQTLAQVRLLSKDWEGVQKVANLIATKPTGEGFSLYLGGKILQGQGAFQKAIVKYQLALASDAQLNDALKSMMVCYKALNKNSLMLVYLNDFIAKNPNNHYPIFLKSEVYSTDKKWDAALAVLNTGLLKWPKDIRLYEAIARIYTSKNDTEKTIQVYEEGLAVQPDNRHLRMLLATAYENKQDYKTALKHYETLVNMQPNLDIAVNNFVSLLLDHFPSKENTAKAVRLAQRFNDSKRPHFLDTYGSALLQNGQTQEALLVFKKVTALMPDIAVFKYHLGLAYSRLNMNDKAISALEHALTLSAKDDSFTDKELAKQLLEKIKKRAYCCSNDVG